MLGAQAAREQEKHEGRFRNGVIRPVDEQKQQLEAMQRIVENSVNVRLGVLRLAQDAPAAATLSAEDVVKRATVYLTFIKGENHG